METKFYELRVNCNNNCRKHGFQKRNQFLKACFSLDIKIFLYRRKILKILFLNLIVKETWKILCNFIPLCRAGKASPHSLIFFFFLIFLCKEKFQNFSYPRILHGGGGDIDSLFYFSLYYWFRWLERFWQGWKSIRRCFLFIPSENWIGSSISPGEGGSSADSYYSLSFSR